MFLKGQGSRFNGSGIRQVILKFPNQSREYTVHKKRKQQSSGQAQKSEFQPWQYC